MEQKNFKKVMRWLGQILRCPVCNFKYNLNEAKVLGSQEDKAFDEAEILIHSDCQKCKSSVMFNIEIRGPEIFSVGMITDLTSQDSKKFRGKSPISPNELISMHKSLKSFQGDFIGTFKSF